MKTEKETYDKIVSNTVENENGCWEWQKSTNSAGYGQTTHNKKYTTTHRFVYEYVNGKLEEGQVVRHICHNPKCCNPAHLIVGSHKDNWHDSAEIHREASRKQRKTWIIGDKKYDTFRHAVKESGISSNSINKYTTNGVFDVEAYREGCKIANKVPKI